jgi:glycosyltransferase involved in cell wall biosynthesis
MISVFTPSHDPKYLDDCYKSLKEQTNGNWEWIVLLNGEAIWEKPQDDRVKLTYAHSNIQGVGALKREAVSLCTGDIILELDHDDMLMPTALMDVEYCFDNMPEVGFVYSDTAQVLSDGKPDLTEPFGKAYGWKYYSEEGYLGALGFEDYPHNMSYIWYAPNHLRAFRSALYAKIEGYRANLEVLDDQDIMTQFYQTGTKFYHIPEILYLQRVHPGNTQTVRNAEIQAGTVDMYYQTIEKNCLAWANREGLLALDLGAHHNKAEGFLGVDLRPGPGVNYVGNIFDMDIADDSVGVIRAYDFMEHIAEKTAFMEWCYDKLAHGGMLLSMTPSSDGRGAFQDPTHVAFWNENSFWYYTDEHYASFIDFKCRFQQSAMRSFFPSEWHREHHIPYVQANLIAVKGMTHDFGGLLNV